MITNKKRMPRQPSKMTCYNYDLLCFAMMNVETLEIVSGGPASSSLLPRSEEPQALQNLLATTGGLAAEFLKEIYRTVQFTGESNITKCQKNT